MNIGMMWLDDDKKRSVDEKVRRAADFYRHKYGRLPEKCFVNVKAVSGKKKVGKIEVEPAKSVLPHHFWLGMKTNKKQ